jgi:rod shape-determining protein MreD
MTIGTFMLIALAIVYQTVALPLYQIGAAGPDFVLVAVGYPAMYGGGAAPIVLATMTGLLVDALSLEPWGAHALGYVVAAGILQVARRGGWGASALGRLGWVSTAVAVAFLLRLSIVGDAADPRLAVKLWAVALSTTLTIAASLLVFPLLDVVRLRVVRLAPGRLAELRR